jgi:lysozyme
MRKNKIAKLIIILLIINFLWGCNNKKEEENPSLTKITVKNNSFEYAERKNNSISDALNITDGEFINVEDKINTLVLGEHTINVKYKNSNGKMQKYKFAYTVKDTTKPMILHRSVFNVNVGSNPDILSQIICGDNYDSNLECDIEGEYDFNKTGEYKVYFTAKDSSGNVTKSPFKIVVKEKQEPSDSNNTPVKSKAIADFINKYKNDNNQIGIDVSTWQGDVDYEKVKNAGIDFVFIRLGFANKDGKITLDNKFKQNLENAKGVGLKVGVYFYSKASTVMMAKEQAKYVIDVLDGEELSLPVAFDWECWNDFNSFHISYTDLNLIAEEFIKTVQNAGYIGMNYGSASYLEKVWFLDEYPVWMAHYTTKTDFKKEYYIWQASNVGVVPGIDGFVDLDVLYINDKL